MSLSVTSFCERQAQHFHIVYQAVLTPLSILSARRTHNFVDLLDCIRPGTNSLFALMFSSPFHLSLCVSYSLLLITLRRFVQSQALASPYGLLCTLGLIDCFGLAYVGVVAKIYPLLQYTACGGCLPAREEFRQIEEQRAHGVFGIVTRHRITSDWLVFLVGPGFSVHNQSCHPLQGILNMVIGWSVMLHDNIKDASVRVFGAVCSLGLR
jgi:hypothetical protein